MCPSVPLPRAPGRACLLCQWHRGRYGRPAPHCLRRGREGNPQATFWSIPVVSVPVCSSVVRLDSPLPSQPPPLFLGCEPQGPPTHCTVGVGSPARCHYLWPDTPSTSSQPVTSAFPGGLSHESPSLLWGLAEAASCSDFESHAPKKWGLEVAWSGVPGEASLSCPWALPLLRVIQAVPPGG